MTMRAAAVLIFAIVLLGLSLLWLAFVKSLRCGDFTVQGDAQLLYYFGAHQLDGNDHDEKACESLLNPRKGTYYW